MKKWLIILGMITCMMGLTACGAEDKEEALLMPDIITEKFASDYIDMLSSPQAKDSYHKMAEYGIKEAVMYDNAYEPWESAMDEIGGYVKYEVTENSLEVMFRNSEYGQEAIPMEGTLVVELTGANQRKAWLEIIFERGELASISTNVDHSFGENMKNAGLNTLLGMGTVFSVLILISLIISAFGVIPKVQAKFNKKNNAAEAKTAAVNNTISQIIEKEELSDDLELAAVIAAAIAASEGAASTDGFVVRSIRRRGNKWQSAGRAGV